MKPVPMGVQQRLMRHADVRTTMNVYGDGHKKWAYQQANEQNREYGLIAYPACADPDSRLGTSPDALYNPTCIRKIARLYL